MFHRKQLIQQVILPSFNHCYMTLGYDQDSGSKLDKQVIKLLWTGGQRWGNKTKKNNGGKATTWGWARVWGTTITIY